ncbi:hypothetical protein ST37_01795 (plasmid) [Vibrio sp. qd031]|uniref:hypothetical protein n=1 Tax=Vibrio sp. qd031 TaxID=1603038 RepID=UPI000A0F5FBC|nr:hypothetical protein [Vibrio sp. qd031]ORT52526.1 hypothetical protein ST37_01795 [Vibrio sp. qd031]
MATVELYSNANCMPTGQELPREFHPNFYRALAECEHVAGREASFVSQNVAIVPFSKDLRLVVMV